MGFSNLSSVPCQHFFFKTPLADRLICFSGKVQHTRFAWSQQSFKSFAFRVVEGAVIFQWLKGLFAKQPVENNGSGSSAYCCWCVG